ncbi:MAG: hypothetical protein RIK87_15195 [Fuerstiella sp.]
MNGFHNHQIREVALVREQRQRVRDLSGFRSSHKVPAETSERTQAFVGRIADSDISDDLDARFSEFRRHFGFKRRDLRVSEPENGTGAIATPWFEYRVTVTQATDDSSEAVWRRQVSDFRQPEPLLSSEFATAFGKLFDTVEFEPPEPLDIEDFIDRLEARHDPALSLDYDRTATWCQLTSSDIPGLLNICSDRIALRTMQPDLPARLLESFFLFRSCLKGIECF